MYICIISNFFLLFLNNPASLPLQSLWDLREGGHDADVQVQICAHIFVHLSIFNLPSVSSHSRQYCSIKAQTFEGIRSNGRAWDLGTQLIVPSLLVAREVQLTWDLDLIW